MNEPYDDDEYGDEYYDYDDKYDPYKFYFKFDIDQNSSLSNWIIDMFSNIFNAPTLSDVPFPVNSWNPNTEKGNTFQYLGSNYQGSPIWKKQYFIKDSINIEYKKHIASHAQHFIKQPVYYNGMFDILN